MKWDNQSKIIPKMDRWRLIPRVVALPVIGDGSVCHARVPKDPFGKSGSKTPNGSIDP
ncbi:MAG: hypothetical protein WBZ48_06835 [Bacteroidota bacterium]